MSSEVIALVLGRTTGWQRHHTGVFPPPQGEADTTRSATQGSKETLGRETYDAGPRGSIAPALLAVVTNSSCWQLLPTRWTSAVVSLGGPVGSLPLVKR